MHREYRFHPTRRWRFDFAWPERMIAAEAHGGTYGWGKSRHTTATGFRGDREKMNAATLLGWKVYEFDSKHVKSRHAVEWMETALV